MKKKAVALYVLSAGQGDRTGQFNLGRCYENAIGGLVKNMKKALELYRLSSLQGLSGAEDALKRLNQSL